MSFRALALTVVLTVWSHLVFAQNSIDQKRTEFINGVAYENADQAPRYAQVGSKSYVLYCREKYYKKEGGKIRCNWGASFTEGCMATFWGHIESGAVISGPKNVGKCSNGDVLLQFEIR
jgi:hypothetical protein